MDGDSGIEDVETLESSLDEMDSSSSSKKDHVLFNNNNEELTTSKRKTRFRTNKGAISEKTPNTPKSQKKGGKGDENEDLGNRKNGSSKQQRNRKREISEKMNQIESKTKQTIKNKKDVDKVVNSNKTIDKTNGHSDEDERFTKVKDKNTDNTTKSNKNTSSNGELTDSDSAASSDKTGNVSNQNNTVNGKAKRDPKDQYCTICEKVEGELIACTGTCVNFFHLNCLGIEKLPNEDFICDKCTTGLYECFICKKNTGEVKKCSNNTCGKFYHILCLGNNNCSTAETKIKNKSTCPLHSCKYCNENKAHQIISNSKKVVKCVKCPTAYHRGSCMPATCYFLNTNLMICDAHHGPVKNNNTIINTTWCISCSFGGSLVCCDTCPASYHVECADGLNDVPEGAWQCNDCSDGHKLRYSDIVWVKFSIYRWWPGQICFADEVPLRVQNLPHTMGEFPVLFFGSRDYAWLNPRRVFKYAQGDRGGSKKKNYLQKHFQKAVEEAKEAFLELEKKKEECMQAYDKKLSNKPPSYRHIKVNKPVSCIRSALDRSEWPICQCRVDPCKNECLNKMLYYECSSSQCPSRELCGNQRIQKFQYAKTKMFKCEDKGWALKADQEIKFGDFVIEYVGELIDEVTCHKRIQQYHERDIYDYYFLTIDKDNIIDAYPRGNLSRFMNHSCDPNCETQKWTVNGEIRVGLFATRDIIVGEELCFNYNLDSLGNEKKACKCGSANCSGFLGVQPKTQHAITVAEKSKNSKLKKTKNNKVKRKKTNKNKKAHDDECFSCGDGGELICCDRSQCTKAYHKDCLIMDKPPTGKWQCPWHFCDECGKLARSMCSLCPNSVCESHFEGQMIELKDDVLVCPAHTEEELEFLRNSDKSDKSDSSSDTNGEIDSTSSSPKNEVTKKEMKSLKDEGENNETKRGKKRKNDDTVNSLEQNNSPHLPDKTKANTNEDKNNNTESLETKKQKQNKKQSLKKTDDKNNEPESKKAKNVSKNIKNQNNPKESSIKAKEKILKKDSKISPKNSKLEKIVNEEKVEQSNKNTMKIKTEANPLVKKETNKSTNKSKDDKVKTKVDSKTLVKKSPQRASTRTKLK